MSRLKMKACFCQMLELIQLQNIASIYHRFCLPILRSIVNLPCQEIMKIATTINHAGYGSADATIRT